VITRAARRGDGAGAPGGPPEHPDTLTARGNLAYWTGEAGDAAAAQDQYAALLPVLDWVLGPEHPETLTAPHELARWTGWADGRPSGA